MQRKELDIRRYRIVKNQRCVFQNKKGASQAPTPFNIPFIRICPHNSISLHKSQ